VLSVGFGWSHVSVDSADELEDRSHPRTTGDSSALMCIPHSLPSFDGISWFLVQEVVVISS
jgi:hypothetical protein